MYFRKQILRSMVAGLVSIAIPLSVSAEESLEEYVKDSWIFVFKDDVGSDQVEGMAQGLSAGNGPIRHVYKHSIKGFAAKMPEQAAMNILKANKNIAYVSKDMIVHAYGPKDISPTRGKPPKDGGDTGGTTPEVPPQEIPWGIERVNGASINCTDISDTARVAWVIDTGIDLDHPDLNVDSSRGASFIRRGDKNDKNGHGTHVAGTIGAIDNSEGVVGVCPGVTVIPVQVLDSRGSGSLSGVIGGIDFVAANGKFGDVANMSLGGGISNTLDQAVKNASVDGIRFVLAAGNESDNANSHSPARAEGDNIYTVSAMDEAGKFAYFSNYGNPPIDYAAPGVDIESTWKDGGYNTISGTSMAAPHVAGLLLLGPIASATDCGFVLSDPDGNPDQIACHKP